MLNAEAFALAFAIAVMSYIGLSMWRAYKEAVERDER
jgi:hypothetical protein